MIDIILGSTEINVIIDSGLTVETSILGNPTIDISLTGAVNTSNASQIEVDTSNFDGNLSSSDDTIQKALDTLDDLSGLSGGEINTASNVGSSGVGLFKQKSGFNLQFKNINTGSNNVIITDDTSHNEVDIDINSDLELNSLKVGTDSFYKVLTNSAISSGNDTVELGNYDLLNNLTETTSIFKLNITATELGGTEKVSALLIDCVTGYLSNTATLLKALNNVLLDQFNGELEVDLLIDSDELKVRMVNSGNLNVKYGISVNLTQTMNN